DGRRIAWVETRLDQERNLYRAAIWIAQSDGGNRCQLTSGQHRDQYPRWSPDSQSLAFVSNRPNALPAEASRESEKSSGSTPDKPRDQVWTICIDGGEAFLRTSHPSGAASPCWSPDGASIAFTAADPIGETDTFTAPSSVGPIADERVVNDISYRFDGRGFLEKYRHIWIVSLADGVSKQLTFGDASDDAPAWSPDGTLIAFTSGRSEDRRRFWNRSAVHTAAVSDGKITTISPEDAQFSTPAWSPNGETLAFIGHLGTGSATNDAVWTARPDGADLTNLTEASDISFGDSGMSDVHAGSYGGPQWLDDGSMLVLASQRGETQVYRVTTDRTVKPVTAGEHRIAGFAPLGDDLAVVRGTIAQPFELESWVGGGPAGTISHANDVLLAEVELIDAIHLPVKSADGTEIQTWLIPPSGFDESSGAKHPLILQIHGGPHSMYGYAMFHEMQLMAAKGYAVLFSNPRGSAGYGQEFTGCTRGIWGEADMPDILAAIEATCHLPWIDTDRLGITGGSYGGYLTNWTIGHDRRFKAAVTQRCVSNFYSFFGTSDIGTTFGVTEFDGLPWSDAEKLLRHSPISYVDKIETPLLILHSEQDLRCPIEQAELMFASLKYLDKDVAFVRIPDEGHDLSRSGTPSRRLARLHHLIGWFDQKL
ncbi:MAG: S9 family peptidase, partial [Chloroflexia bacterium]|nr:S9 family peptidase [Chloroflexia bacterium]